jgi:hypothetical protein
MKTEENLVVFSRQEINLELHQLISLDANVANTNDTETAVSTEILREIVNYTKIFDHANTCLDYLRYTEDVTTSLVCSGQLGRQLFPNITHFENGTNS